MIHVILNNLLLGAIIYEWGVCWRSWGLWGRVLEIMRIVGAGVICVVNIELVGSIRPKI